VNPLLLSAVVSAALAFGSAWQIQSWRIDSLKLEQANEQLAREQSSRQQLAEAAAKVEAAQVAARVATDRVRRDAARVDRAAIGMRDTLSRSVLAAHTDLNACTTQVTTISELFTASTELSGRIAKEAGEWVNQAIVLQDAWPK
jgi:GTP cyclohydrolase III